MKLAFSNSVFPELDLDGLIEKSSQWGYDGFELTALHGEADLGLIATLSDQAEAVQQKLAAAGQRIAAINAGEFVAHDSTAREGGKRRVISAIKAASAVGCRLVTVRPANEPRGAIHQRILDSVVEGLAPAAREAEAAGIVLGIENSGAVARTHDLWFVRDAVCSPAVRVCISPRRSAQSGDSPSTVLNRLGASLAMVRFATSDLPEQAFEGERFVPEAGSLNPEFLLEILKGFAYEGWIGVNPAPGADEAAAGDALTHAAKFLRAETQREQVVLTAYKGDKNTPKFTTRSATA